MIIGVATDAGLVHLRFERTRIDVARSLDDEAVRCLLPGGDGTLLCGTEGGLFVRDLAPRAQWRRSRGIPDAAPVTALAQAAATGSTLGTIWAGTEPSAVYRSSDGGRTWTPTADLTDLPSAASWSYPPRPDTHHVRTMLSHPESPQRLLAGVEAGAVVSTEDGGRTWLDRRPTGPRDPHALLTGPAGSNHVVAAAGDGWHESLDFGHTWTTPSQGMDHGYVWDTALAAHAGQPVLLAVAASHARAAHGGGVEPPAWHLYRRGADGPWTEVRAGLPAAGGRVPSITALPGPVGGFALCTQDLDLFVSNQAGTSWRTLDVAWPDRFQPSGVRSMRVLAD